MFAWRLNTLYRQCSLNKQAEGVVLVLSGRAQTGWFQITLATLTDPENLRLPVEAQREREREREGERERERHKALRQCVF